MVQKQSSLAGFKKKKLLNRNFINNGSGAQSGASGVDFAASVQREKEQDDLDRECGFHLFNDGPQKLGWLINFNTCSIEDKDSGQLCSAVACYFICQSGEMFKCKLQYSPYFYLQVKDDRELEVEAYLRRKFEGAVLVCLPIAASSMLAVVEPTQHAAQRRSDCSACSRMHGGVFSSVRHGACISRPGISLKLFTQGCPQPVRVA